MLLLVRICLSLRSPFFFPFPFPFPFSFLPFGGFWAAPNADDTQRRQRMAEEQKKEMEQKHKQTEKIWEREQGWGGKGGEDTRWALGTGVIFIARTVIFSNHAHLAFSCSVHPTPIPIFSPLYVSLCSLFVSPPSSFVVVCCRLVVGCS